MGVLVTVATLVAARDGCAQSLSVMAQAIPLVTHAAPTAGSRNLTEAYLTQPVAMSHAEWKEWQAIGTLDLEGLTLGRGELNTGGYGEGYVDRRHPHTYVHELLLGRLADRGNLAASLFAGRGFVPFGSDDPMMRPFVKYPVNHHLAQILERVVTVGAIRYGRVIAEAALFNGDEPLSPGAAPNFRRFGDSWSSRLTLLASSRFELSTSYAKVASPEVRFGHGADQDKAGAVVRYAATAAAGYHYALIEYAHTGEGSQATIRTNLSSVLAEAAACRRGVEIGGRFERTDRPEEEMLLDPFRTARPATDLHNLGLSTWKIATIAATAPSVTRGSFRARPFVEVSRSHVEAGRPAGLFSAQARYGSPELWMVSAGVRLAAGSVHSRMGRYGAALPMPSMSSATVTHGPMPAAMEPVGDASHSGGCSR